MKVLSVSDVELNMIYSPQITERFDQIDAIISCGDLPFYYLEYMISMLNRPLYFVRGNHAQSVEYGSGWDRHFPLGGCNLHRRAMRSREGLLMAGVEGSLRYNKGPYQYTQNEMWMHVFRLVPRLLLNKLRFGRYLDIFVSHAPAWKIHDADDQPHRGIKAFRWLDSVFQPAYHLHGHVHIYRQDGIYFTFLGKTRIINTYGYRVTDIPIPDLKI